MLLTCLLALTTTQERDWAQLDRDIAQQRVVQIYEVADLIDPRARDFEAVQLGVSTKPGASEHKSEPAPAEPTREDRVRATEAFSALISKHIEPKLDPALDQLGPISDGSFVLRAPPKAHDWVAGFLATQRGFDGLILTDARLFTVDRSVLAGLDLTSGATFKSKEDGDRFLELLRKDRSLEELVAPRVTSFPRQRASLAMATPFTYVRDWTIEIVEPGAHEIADPEIAVIYEGTTLDVRVIPMSGGRLLAEFSLQHCELERPVRVERVTIGSKTKHEVEVALPAAATQRFTSTVLLADGASVLLTSEGLESDKLFAAVVTLRSVKDETPRGGK